MNNVMEFQSNLIYQAVAGVLDELKANHIENCQVCKDNQANTAYFEKHGSWSPFLTTVTSCPWMTK